MLLPVIQAVQPWGLTAGVRGAQVRPDWDDIMNNMGRAGPGRAGLANGNTQLELLCSPADGGAGLSSVWASQLGVQNQVSETDWDWIIQSEEIK